MTQASLPAALPAPGETYEDVGGRILGVEEVVRGDPAGREVRGRIRRRDGRPAPGVPYSCDLTVWADVWRDRVRRVPSHQFASP